MVHLAGAAVRRYAVRRAFPFSLNVLSTLLLAAGLGSRLDPLTRLVAKPAVPLGDRTLVEHVLAWLARQQVADVVVNLHHRPETLTRVLGDGQHLGVPLRYSWEGEVLGSAGGPRRALPLLGSDPVLIVNGDTLCDVDLSAMVDAHQASGARVTMALVPNTHPAHYNGVVLDEHDAILGFIPRGHSEPSWHFVGVQVANKDVFAGLADGVPAESVSGIYRDLLRTAPGSLHGWRISSTFLDIGTPRDYLAASLMQPDDGLSGRVLPASAHVARCAVWPDVVFQNDVRLEDCIVAGPLTVPSGLDCRAAILMPSTVVRPGDRARVQGDVAIFPLDLDYSHR
jgi:NDP-sugar pyrophosphorylase family protein